MKDAYIILRKEEVDRGSLVDIYGIYESMEKALTVAQELLKKDLSRIIGGGVYGIYKVELKKTVGVKCYIEDVSNPYPAQLGPIKTIV